MVNFLERLRLGKRFSGTRWACLQFKDKVIEEKFQQSFIQDSFVFVRIVKAATIVMCIVVVVNRLAQ